jgi:hypothetical protein
MAYSERDLKSFCDEASPCFRQLLNRGVSNKCLYSASHSRVAPENVGLQKEPKCNTFACHTCNEVRLCVL